MTPNFVETDVSHKRSVPISNGKKVSLSSRNKKLGQPTNEAVLNFISDSTTRKNQGNNSTMTGSSTLTNITENQKGE